MVAEAEAAAPVPPLLPALAGMTGLQALVALALFAPGVLAPRLGIDPAGLGLFTTTGFSVGMATSLCGGLLAGRLGSFRVASFCALAAAAAMLCAAIGGGAAALLAAGIAIGLACGPETPASAAILGRLVREADRPMVFSVRQTGNQIGAIAGSLALPVLAAVADPRAGYVAIAALALLCVPVFERLRPAYDPLTRSAAAGFGLGTALRLLWIDPALRRMALAAFPYSASQLTLNGFFVVFAVTELGLGHVAAGVALAAGQAGGLVGRLGWGVVASHWMAPRLLVGLLGLGMAAASVLVALAGGAMPFPVLMLATFLFGLTASGWNGVFLAEVARLAPVGRIGEATGAVMVGGFAGLIAGPVLLVAAAALSSLAAGYVLVGLLAALAGLSLFGDKR
ncbi:Predicted arabinose efflux permease, MFS family [Azospirillum oryzae]|uniref:Predicted arabinose efflux permease, MFS family n=1 Tax=Azospirillum oryzae TaxID=286727 RepID=A0A1X7HN09_9PROT|nr:MFS transporter [Azospirillum oryzae]SMF89260.1 Predicted arabinose efflux permease, MFS family [Azospirillum oryzae]